MSLSKMTIDPFGRNHFLYHVSSDRRYHTSEGVLSTVNLMDSATIAGKIGRPIKSFKDSLLFPSTRVSNSSCRSLATL